MNDLRIQLPYPHPKQLSIIHHPAQRHVICAGRRGGKTTTCAMVATKDLFDFKKVLLTSTSQDQADAFWEKLTTWLYDAAEAGVVKKNEARRTITYRGNDGRVGRVRVKTGRNHDALRGGDADTLVLDEAARLDERAWNEVGAPMLMDRGGRAYFISTPNRRNWFYHMYLRGMDPRNSAYKAWHFTSFDNPHLNREALKLITQDMTQEAILQEILARFLEGQGLVFRNVRKLAKIPTMRLPYEGRFVMGLDWAQEQDYTCAAIIDAETYEIVYCVWFQRVDFPVQRMRITALQEQWKCERIICEINSIGKPNFQELQREGLPVIAFETTAKSKPPLIENMVLALEKQRVRMVKNDSIINQFEAFEKKVTQHGHTQYNAPAGMNDDIVIASCLALWGIDHYSSFAEVW